MPQLYWLNALVGVRKKHEGEVTYIVVESLESPRKLTLVQVEKLQVVTAGSLGTGADVSGEPHGRTSGAEVVATSADGLLDRLGFALAFVARGARGVVGRDDDTAVSLVGGAVAVEVDNGSRAGRVGLGCRSSAVELLLRVRGRTSCGRDSSILDNDVTAGIGRRRGSGATILVSGVEV